MRLTTKSTRLESMLIALTLLDIIFIDDSEDVVHQPPFISLLPEDTTQFYRYSGSLTTPECNEAVTWTIFRQTARVSLSQVSLHFFTRVYKLSLIFTA